MSFTQLPTQPLGKNGPQVPRLGLGTVSLAGVYGFAGTDADRLAFLDEAYKRGELFWDAGTTTYPFPTQ
jgi:aryl-alcohol dehydrogenase-like predicted oxidoreductase